MKLEDKDLKIIYLDNHILVADKMKNIPTQGNSKKIGFDDLLKKYLKEKYLKKNVFLHPVHRIDKITTGLVLFARTSKALSRLNEKMREKKIERAYFAKVEGVLKKKKGFLENYLEKKNFYSKVHKNVERDLFKKAPLKKVPLKKVPLKKACLYYEVIKEENNNSFLKIELYTGRYHQIRAQFSNIGHPVFADIKYGSRAKGEIFLNSCFLEFEHPVTKKKMSFFSNFKALQI